jgi:hypothetical protein
MFLFPISTLQLRYFSVVYFVLDVSLTLFFYLTKREQLRAFFLLSVFGRSDLKMGIEEEPSQGLFRSILGGG